MAPKQELTCPPELGKKPPRLRLWRTRLSSTTLTPSPCPTFWILTFSIRTWRGASGEGHLHRSSLSSFPSREKELEGPESNRKAAHLTLSSFFFFLATE